MAVFSIVKKYNLISEIYFKIKLFTVNANVKNKSCNYVMDINKQVKLLNGIKNGISDNFT